MSRPYILDGFHHDISEDQSPSTVGNAEHLAVTVPEDLATIVIYEEVVKTVPTSDLIAVDTSWHPVSSIILPQGIHLVVKTPQQFIGCTDAEDVYATKLKTR